MELRKSILIENLLKKLIKFVMEIFILFINQQQDKFFIILVFGKICKLNWKKIYINR